MNIFSQKYTLKGWQYGLMKLSLITFGIILGVYFVDFWIPLMPFVWVVCVVSFILVFIFFMPILQTMLKNPHREKPQHQEHDHSGHNHPHTH